MIGKPRRDVLLYGLSQSLDSARLIHWSQTTPNLHAFVPDFHRLQLEHWIWRSRDQLRRPGNACARILDVGVIVRREYLGPGYSTFGLHNEDVIGDLRAMPFSDGTFDGIVLTEVLEHCENPFEAIAEVYRVLAPGGLLLVTSPFLWPDHHTADYPDYWRFTEQAWRLLLKRFESVDILRCEWTDEGAAAYDLARRFECWGHADHVTGTTGYLCSAWKAGA